ncbi:MAG: hypothetical protein H6589_06325 [Flavobacteriales bacterium]|nr:hypothetical protein [Flavobacteriales bacterium]
MIVKGTSPLAVIQVNDSYILGIYQGSLSKFDLLLKYRQIDNSTKSGWSRIRTPKHMHWAVDALIKMQHQKTETKKFISFLINMWDNNIEPIKSKKHRDEILNIDKLKKEINKEAKKYPKLAGKGEYSIKFLYLIAKLLMVQEKTNLSTAFMFRQLLEALKDNKDIFKIVSLATHNGR